MELGNIVELLDNKTILVTGATGFIAKLFVEKILRVQPKVKKIYLLLRAGDEKSAMERMHKEVIGKILFDVLRKKYGEEGLISLVSKKVCPVPGDVSKENLGVDIGSSLRDEMLGEIEFVVNFAATTNFNERYDVSLGTNTFGALHVLNFAKSCAKLKKLIHVSTAYVCGEEAGRILEKPFQLGEARKGNKRIDIDLEQKMVQEKLRELLSKYGDDQSPITSFLKDLGTQRAKHYGWPNSYVFTKSMGEMLLMHLKDNVPLLILRPTMVTSTYKEPFPGWIEDARTFDGVIMAYGLGKLKCFLFNPESICDAIPGDMVVNGIIVAMMMVHDNKKLSSEIVYHLGSSYRNPLMFQDLQAFTIRYFSGNPLIGKDGNPIIPPKFTPLTTITSFRIYKMLRISLPIKAFEMVNIILCGKYQDTYDVLNRRVKLMTKFADFYAPFGLFKGIFDDTNSEELRRKARLNGSDALAFDFDPMSINWEDYMVNIHIPGLVKYAMK